MNIPAFTAEASFYKTSGHYRTGPYISSAQAVSPLWPAAEVIEVHDCDAGFIKLGEWPNMSCIPDPDYTGGNDDQGEGPPENGQPTGEGKRPPKRTPPPRGSHYCTPDDPVVKANPDSFRDCGLKNVGQDISRSLHEAWCGPGDKMWCCEKRRANNSFSCKSVHDPRIPLGGGIPIGGGIPLGGGI